jgi:DNA-damage-inducible protein J
MTTASSNKTAEVRSRIEPELKDDAIDILDRIGLSLSDAIRLFLRQVVATKGLPFEVKVPAATLTAMQEARTMKTARFGSAEEMFNELETRKV